MMGWETLSRVMEESRTKGADRLVLLSIAYHVNEQRGDAYPSVPTIARESGLNPRSVSRSLRSLEEAGEVRISLSSGPKGCHLYRVSSGQGDEMPGMTIDPATPDTRTPEQEGTGSIKRSSNEDPKEVRDLFDFWRQTFDRDSRTQLTPKRRTHLRARLRDSTPEEIRQAILGVRADEWLVANGHTDLTMICRSRDQIERYRGKLAVKAAPAPLDAGVHSRPISERRFSRNDEPTPEEYAAFDAMLEESA